MTRRATALVVATALCGLAPKVAAGQEARPVLGGHRFVWNPYTHSPIPRTHVRSLTGGGKFLDVEFIPSFQIDTVTYPAVKGDLLFTELEFEYMHRVQPWLGVWVNVGGLARLGTEAGVLLADGITTVVGYELGWLFRLHETESFYLSGTAALSNDGVTDVDVFRWATALFTGGDDPLVRADPWLRARGGLRAAWGIDETWGLQAETTLGYGESARAGEPSHWFWDLAVSASVDLYPSRAVPLGFALSLASRASPREGVNPDLRNTDLALRTAFTGSDDFLVGLDTSWTRFRSGEDQRSGLLRMGLALHLYF